MDKVRVIIDPPAAGSWNMAVDHALLETANQTGVISIRFYQWSEPTLSLGYFQHNSERASHPASSECPLVRRTTGGGAILHDRELTYSLCVPSANRWSKANEQIYFMMHQIIVDLLAERNVDAELFDPQTMGDVQYDAKTFLCFQRRTQGDVVAMGKKICGSAQRRKKNAILQHGSLLLEASKQAPELPGINDLFKLRKIETEDLIDAIKTKLAKRLGVDLSFDSLTDYENKVANDVNTNIYTLDGWNLRR